MYIIAKKNEKDYYDGVVGTVGIDKTIVYERNIIDVENNKIPPLFKEATLSNFDNIKNNYFHQLHDFRIDKIHENKFPYDSYFIVGFCGKLYVGWKLYSFKNINNDVLITITYDLDYIFELFDEKNRFGNSLYDIVSYILNYDAIDLFRELNTPIFIYDYDSNVKNISGYCREYHNSKFIINPLLKNYEFYKKFDSFQTFQEISMFIGGVLGSKEKKIIEVEDKYKIAQHGFNKWSFRKEPKDKSI